MFGRKSAKKGAESNSSPPEAPRSSSTNSQQNGPSSPARATSGRTYYSASSNGSNHAQGGNPTISLPMSFQQTASGTPGASRNLFQQEHDQDQVGHTVSRAPSRASSTTKDLPPVAEHSVYQQPLSPTKPAKSTQSSAQARSARPEPPAYVPHYAAMGGGSSHAHSGSGSGSSQQSRQSANRYTSTSSTQSAGNHQTFESVSSRHTASSLSHTPSIRSIRSATSEGATPTPNGGNPLYSDYPRRPSMTSATSGVSASNFVPPTPVPSEFSFPKPSRPDQIEVMFSELLDRIGVQGSKRFDMLSWSTDKKWQLVQAEKLNEAKSKEKENSGHGFSGGHLRERIRSGLPSGASAVGARDSAPLSNVSTAATGAEKARIAARKDSPEFYLGAFFDKTIDPKKVAHLNVSLRTYEISWLRSFIDLKGQSVLSNTLSGLNRNQSWRDPEIAFEYELLKCLKTLLNSKYGARDAISQPKCITNITLSLTSPHLPSRKTVCDILTFLSYWDAPKGHQCVLDGLDVLTQVRGEVGRFDAWFATFESTVDGRGRMGSMVGASEEIRSLRGRDMAAAMAARDGNSPLDSALSEYALSNLLLINAVLQVPEELAMRVHIRNQMEASGLRRILDKLRGFSHPMLDRQLDSYDSQTQLDMSELQETYQTDALEDMSDPYEVLRAVLVAVEGTRAQDFLLSALKHLLLVPDDAETKVRYYRLLDKLVTSVVMDRKMGQHAIEGDFSQMFGSSVEEVVSRFTDQDRLQKAIDEAQMYKAQAGKFKTEKAALEDQILEQQGGLVSQLKTQLARTEEDLRVSRQATDALNHRMEDMETQYTDKIAELETQIRELFKMLQEARMLEIVEDEHGVLDRRELVALMQKKMERTRTVYALEGRSLEGQSPKEPHQGLRSSRGASGDKRPSALRASAFEDAADETVRAHIEEALANGASSPFNKVSPQSTRNVKRTPAVRKSHGGRPSSSSISVHTADTLDDQDSTPQASRYTTQAAAPPQLAAVASPSRKVGPSSLQPFGRPQQPVDLLAQIRARRADDTDTEDEGEEESRPRQPPAESDRDASSTASLSRASGTTAATSITSVGAPSKAPAAPAPPPPPPPPAPPPPAASGAPPPPPPPPPPPAPGSAPVKSPLAFAAELLAAGPKLRTPSSATLKEGEKAAPQDAVVSPSGSLVIPRAPAAPAAPAAPSAPGAPPAPMRAFGSAAVSNKKAVAISAKQRTKQVQWDMVAASDLSKTVWANKNGDVDEGEVAKMLLQEGIFDEMEEDFKTIIATKAKIPSAVGSKQEKQLISVLTPKMRERIGIILSKQTHRDEATHGNFTDQVSRLIHRLLQVDDDLCTDAFLEQLKPVLPTPEDVGKLSTYKGASEEIMETLNRADRFMVALIQVYRPAARISGLLFRATFEENATSLRRRTSAIREGCEALQSEKAPRLRDLLNIALTLGNFLNANIKGGAYGFRLSSLNKFIDCKSGKGTTLLHTLQRVVTTRFPEIAGFRDEIEKPVDAYRFNLDEVEKEVNQLFTQLNAIKKDLKENFEDLENINEVLDPDDRYPSIMYRFTKDATDDLRSLRDQITLCKSLFKDALQLYQEDHRSQTTSEFFSILKTFSVSWENVARENTAVKQREEAIQKRKEAHEMRKRELQAAKETALAASEDRQLADDLLVKLREGNLRSGKRAQRKGKPSISAMPPVEESKQAPQTPYSIEDPESIARNLLKELHGDAFELKADHTPKPRPRRQNSVRHSSQTANSDEGSAFSSPVQTTSKRATSLSQQDSNASPPSLSFNLDADQSGDIQLALRALAMSDDETSSEQASPVTKTSVTRTEKESTEESTRSPTHRSGFVDPDI